MLKNISDSDLTALCVSLLSKSYLDLGQHNIDAESKVKIAQNLCFDLKMSFTTLEWKDVEMAFWNGIRNTEDFSINAKTYYKWLKIWKKIIDTNECITDEYKDKRLIYRSAKGTGMKSINNDIKKLTNK